MSQIPIINGKHLPYTKENIAMARKMSKVITTPKSREEILTDKWIRNGSRGDVSIPRYPIYAKGKSNNA